MKIKKENGRYYVNDLDLEEVLANRRHLNNYINKEIGILEDLMENIYAKPELMLVYKTRLKVLQEIRREMQLRK